MNLQGCVNTVQLTEISSTSLGRAQCVFSTWILPRLEMHIRNSTFPVEGKQRALIHMVKANCEMLQRAAEAAEARDAKPLRSAALVPMGRAGYGERDPAPAWAGRWWHPVAAAWAEGSAQLRGKHPANLPALLLYKISTDF